MGINPANELFSRTSNLINNAFDRFNKIVVDVTARDYSATKLISDNAATWFDLATVWFFPLEQILQLINNSSPVVNIQIKTTDDTGTGATDIQNAGVFPVVSTDLALESDVTVVIPHDNVFSQIVSGGDMIVVTLSGLQKLAPPPQPGSYRGMIFRTDVNPPQPTLIAIQVDVTN